MTAANLSLRYVKPLLHGFMSQLKLRAHEFVCLHIQLQAHDCMRLALVVYENSCKSAGYMRLQA
jgi:hypothetical protein